MAIITLRQLLHRPAPGGPIDPNDPLPVRLYGPNGEPIGTQDDALKVTLSGQTVEEDGTVRVRSVGTESTDGQTLIQDGTGMGDWLDVRGYNRAVLLLQPGNGWINPTSTISRYVLLQGRVDGETITLPVHYFNSGVTTTRISQPGYYELDINPLQQIRAWVIGGAPATVTAWFSATTFVPDTPGVSIELLNSVALSGTDTVYSPSISGLGWDNAKILVQNTHDAALRMRLLIDMPGSGFGFSRGIDGAVFELTIPASSGRMIITEDDWPPLRGILPELFKIAFEPVSPPTTGQVSAYLIAEPS